MSRLTHDSPVTDMVWFIDHENNDAFLEPCEMDSHHSRLAIQKLAQYEKKEELGLLKLLPCPIGTIVHKPYRFCGEGSWEIDHHKITLEDLDKIGITVFVDIKDAENYIAEQEAYPVNINLSEFA